PCRTHPQAADRARSPAGRRRSPHHCQSLSRRMSMYTRRQWLGRTVGMGAALALNPRLLEALQQQPLLTRAIPSSGEQLPLVGLGSSATFSQVARSEDYSALREVLQALVDHGGRVFD